MECNRENNSLGYEFDVKSKHHAKPEESSFIKTRQSREVKIRLFSRQFLFFVAFGSLLLLENVTSLQSQYQHSRVRDMIPLHKRDVPGSSVRSDFIKRRQRYGKPVFPNEITKITIYQASNDNNNGMNEKGEDILTTKSENWTWIITLVFPLWLVYITNCWSRYSISYLVNFSPDAADVNSFTTMNVDLGFEQFQYGLLASVAFTSLFAIASLFAGVAADKLDRKLLTVISCAAWATATLGTALAGSYEVVVLWRIAMGLACAFTTPAAYTLIQQMVPKTRVALGSSLYGTGVALGSALSSLTIILGNTLGWRQTEILIAALGFGAATLTALFLPSDPKQAINKEFTSNEKIVDVTKAEDQKVDSFSSTLSDVQQALKISRIQWLYTASFLRFCSGLCIGVWGAPYFRMAFPDNQEQYSVVQAAISALGATASGILGGAIADYLSQQNQFFSKTSDPDDPVGRRLIVPVIGSILAAPTWYFAIQYGVGSERSFEISMIWLAAEYFVAECWFGPTISSLQATVGPKIGGTAQGLFSLTGAMANLAPAVLGFFYGQAVSATSGGSPSDELSPFLIGAVCFGYLASAFCFAMASLAGPPVIDQQTKQI